MTVRVDRDEAYDDLSALVLAIHEDPELSRWFAGLLQLTPTQRRYEILRMREQLLATEPGENRDLAIPLALLADDRVFGAAEVALRSL